MIRLASGRQHKASSTAIPPTVSSPENILLPRRNTQMDPRFLVQGRDDSKRERTTGGDLRIFIGVLPIETRSFHIYVAGPDSVHRLNSSHCLHPKGN